MSCQDMTPEEVMKRVEVYCEKRCNRDIYHVAQACLTSTGRIPLAVLDKLNLEPVTMYRVKVPA